jgi:hypothetical protein
MHDTLQDYIRSHRDGASFGTSTFELPAGYPPWYGVGPLPSDYVEVEEEDACPPKKQQRVKAVCVKAHGDRAQEAQVRVLEAQQAVSLAQDRVRQAMEALQSVRVGSVKSSLKRRQKAQVKPEVKVEVTPEVKPEVKVEVTHEVTPEVKVEVTPEVTPEVKPEAKGSQVKREVKVEVTPQVAPDGKGSQAKGSRARKMKKDQ